MITALKLKLCFLVHSDVGISDLQGTLRNGQRCSTSKAYLVPAEDRPNLTILKTAFARKVSLIFSLFLIVYFIYLSLFFSS